MAEVTLPTTKDESDALEIARLLDDTRELIVQAWDRDEVPEYLLVNPRLYRVIANAKAREVDAGRPLRLLGLLLVNSDSTPVDEPRVR